MPAPIDIDKEQVRMLVLSIGVRDAARRLGLNENTVLTWSTNGDWLKATKPQPAQLPKPLSQQGSIVSIKPSDVLAQTLAENERETKLSLSKSIRRMAQEAETAPLAQASDVKSVVQSAALLGGWDKGTGNSYSLNVLSIVQEIDELS